MKWQHLELIIRFIQVKMTVFRDESCTKEDDIMLDLIDVELMKKSGRGLGLSIVGRRNGPGVYISDVVNTITTNSTIMTIKNFIESNNLMILLILTNNFLSENLFR